MILVKPNFIPCVINSIEDDKYYVTAFNKDITVVPENIIIPRLPVYNIREVIQYLDEDTQKWQLCRIIHIDSAKQLYTLHFISETYQRDDLQISFFSLLIKPLIHVKPHDFKITYDEHVSPRLLKGEEHLIKNIQRERVLQLFVIDIYIE